MNNSLKDAQVKGSGIAPGKDIYRQEGKSDEGQQSKTLVQETQALRGGSPEAGSQVQLPFS